MSEQENQTPEKFVKAQEEIQEAPKLCWGAGSSKLGACRHYVYFRRLKKLGMVTEDKLNERFEKTIFYFEDPIFEKEGNNDNIPKQGIVIEVVKIDKDNNVIDISLDFLPVAFSL